MGCPAQLYRDSTRGYSGAKVQVSHPGMATRLVDKNGKLSWKNRKVFVTGSLAGSEGGLQGTEKANWKADSDGCYSDILTRWR
jgi:hypothetical protein